MAVFKVLMNPLSGKFDAEQLKTSLNAMLDGNELEFYDITKIENTCDFLAESDGANVLLCGGDGTLNKFINDTNLNFKNSVYYYAAGNGNDFWTDIGKKVGDAPVCIDEYLKNLPVVTVNGKDYKFINGVGYGIDGYCCEVGDRLKAAGKKVNYTSIAIKGLLFHYKPCNAEVIVDGVSKQYKKVWIAPTMHGRYYGGGMIPTPEQDRLGAEHKVSVCLFYGKGRIKTLMVFPSIFKGQHVKHKNMIDVLTGKEITVKFTSPQPLQIDGETISGVTEYTVKTQL